MEIYKTQNLTFRYSLSEANALSNISINIGEGEFITVAGVSGSGKSTLLRQLKPITAPHGKRTGTVYFRGTDIAEMDLREQTEQIGFVRQNPENGIVTDKVWHELAFGLESLGAPTALIRKRVAETASFFGISEWFHKSTSELSGGQKQILNLASVMVTDPAVLLLDEPTAMLDPLAAREFTDVLARINSELGVTVIIAEQRLENVLEISDKLLVMEHGEIIAFDTPSEAGRKLYTDGAKIFAAMPAHMRIAAELSGEFPTTVRGAKTIFEDAAAKRNIDPTRITEHHHPERTGIPAVELKDVYFKYERGADDVIHNLSAKIYPNEIYALMGANGAGKSTMLSLIVGINKPYRGTILINGKRLNSTSGTAYLPQSPEMLFVTSSVRDDLLDALGTQDLTDSQKDKKIVEIAALCEIDGLLSRHPYDLSGGECQRAAIAKLLLTNPKILLLDEPTKGMDARFKSRFGRLLQRLANTGLTIITVTHDVEFAAEYADMCALFFDGGIVSEGTAREFFAGGSFYTTAANRTVRRALPEAVTVDDVFAACGIEPKKYTDDNEPNIVENIVTPTKTPKNTKHKIRPKTVIGTALIALYAIAAIFLGDMLWARIAGALSLAAGLVTLAPKRTHEAPVYGAGITKKRVAVTAGSLLAAAATVYIGVRFLGDRKYYFISLLIIAETLIPIFVSFESRKPRAREIVTVSVLTAAAVAGRAAFYMLPEFKPTAAIVIISAAAFGGETGFLIGALTAFVSNFFFGQGPWTPWQMLALGLVGLAAGAVFTSGKIRRTRGNLAVFGFLAAIVIYGGIMNPAAVIMWQPNPTWEMITAAYIAGFPLDAVYALATAFFLWFAAEPMLDKLEHTITKYGIMRE